MNKRLPRRLRLLAMTLLLACLPWAGCDAQADKSVSSKVGTSAVDYGLLNLKKDFTLYDQDGKVFHLKDHRGKIVLLFFGYTSCPDVCPVILSKLARTYALLGPQMRQKVLTVFVTIDPERDTPQKIKEYLQYFNVNAVGLTGTKEEIKVVTSRYKAIATKVVTTSSAMGYLFDHTDYLYLIDAQGKTSHLFRPEDKPQDIAQIINSSF